MASKVTSFFILGMLLFCIGALYMVFDIMVTDHLIEKFWVSTPYMEVMGIQWNVIPLIIFLLSLMCFIFAGMSGGSRRVVIQQ